MSYDPAGVVLRELKQEQAELMEKLIELMQITNAQLALMTDEENPPRD